MFAEKINAQNFVNFPYKSSDRVEFEVKNNATYIGAPQMRCVYISLTKYVYVLYEGNYRTYDKIKENTKWTL